MKILLISIVLGFTAATKMKSVYFTHKGVQCDGKCATEGYPYYWCNTVTKSWDYCSPQPGLDSEGQNCIGECTHRLGTYERTCGAQKKCGTVTTHRCVGAQEPDLPADKGVLSTVAKWDEGQYGPTEYCNEGEYVVGVSLIGQRDQGNMNGAAGFWKKVVTIGIWQGSEYDDHGLTGVRLYCSKYPRKNKETTAPASANDDMCTIASNEYFPKDYDRQGPRFCKAGFATGFQVREQDKQGSADDLSITNFNLICGVGGVYIDMESPQVGADGEPHRCPPKTAICGIRTKVESDHLSDNTGLNEIKIFCCNRDTLQGLAESCDPQYAWEETEALHNNRNTTMKHKIHLKFGTSQLDQKRLSHTEIDEEFDQKTVGVGTSAEYKFSIGVKAALTAKFEATWGSHHIREKNDETTTSTNFFEETYHEFENELPPGQSSFVYTLVASCGPFIVRPRKFIVTDTKMESLVYKP